MAFLPVLSLKEKIFDACSFAFAKRFSARIYNLSVCKGDSLYKDLCAFIDSDKAWGIYWNKQFVKVSHRFLTKFHNVLIATLQDPMKAKAANKALSKSGCQEDLNMLERSIEEMQQIFAKELVNGQ